MTNDVGPNTTIVVGQVLTLITILVGIFAQYVREKRQRRWDLEDRKAQRAKLELASTAMTDTVAVQHQETRALIADNTVKTEAAAAAACEGVTAAREAYTEANHVNLKLEALGLEIASKVNALKRETEHT